MTRIKQLLPLTLIAQAKSTDPFYLSESRMDAARWFADLYHRYGIQKGAHVRRVHYAFVSQDPRPLLPDGSQYENNFACWLFLSCSSRDARYAGLVDIDDFIDQKNPDPLVHMLEKHDGSEPEIEAATDSWEDDKFALPDEIPQPSLSLVNSDCPAQPYHVEIWIEKSTMNDILVPLVISYKLNLQALTGEVSLTLCRDLVARAGERPVRILYVSDFDPGGQSMPLTAARKMEWLCTEMGLDIRLDKVTLTKEQCVEYGLPSMPIKDTEPRADKFIERHGREATELDALEALRPGLLRTLLVDEIERFIDPDFGEAWGDACEEAQETLDEITERVLARHADSVAPLEARLAALRAQAEDLKADVDARNEAVAEDLRAEAPYEFTWPEPADATEWEDPLFDSNRDYVEQMDRYKAWQDKPTGYSFQTTELNCVVCGEPFVSKTKETRFCSPKCRSANGIAVRDKVRQAVRLEARIERPCEECKGAFIPSRPDVKYCSQRCQMRAKRRRASERAG
jgi:hypothetical protein